MEGRGHLIPSFVSFSLATHSLLSTQPDHETRPHRTLLVDRLLSILASYIFIIHVRTHSLILRPSCISSTTRLENGGQQQPRPYRTLLSGYAHGHEALVSSSATPVSSTFHSLQSSSIIVPSITAVNFDHPCLPCPLRSTGSQQIIKAY